jgi:acetyl esterase/lipase
MRCPPLRLIASTIYLISPLALSAQAVPPTCANISTGVGASLNGFIPFPASSPWNTNIASAKVDPNSANLIASIGASTNLFPNFGSGELGGSGGGIPYLVVDNTQPLAAIDYIANGNQSDPGPMPIPANAPIEGGPNPGGDRHVIVLDKTNCWLYELDSAYLQPDGSWQAASGAIWDLQNGEHRPWTWTSADAAGLPVFPGLVRYDEVAAGAINHALSFTVPTTREAFVAPAVNWAGNGQSSNAPPMGTRLRLKAHVNISGFSQTNQVILTALKNYGMFLADNGSGIDLIGDTDPRWNNEDLQNLTQLNASNFEVVQMPAITTPANVPAGPLPQILSFTSAETSPGVYNLSWNVQENSYLILTPSPGPVRGSSIQVSPSATTTYSLIATNPIGRDTAQTTITIGASATPQIIKYEWSATACAGPCYIKYFQSARPTHATDPILIWYGGGGWVDLATGCPGISNVGVSTCPDYTYWTNQGYNVYQPDYPLNSQGYLMSDIQAGAACAVSYMAQNNLPGNWNQVVFGGSSAGGPLAFTVGAAPNSFFLSGCPSTSTSWTTVGFILLSTPGCEDSRANCLCNPSTATYTEDKCNNLFGANPLSSAPANNMALASSPDQYLTCPGCWIEKGAPPIVQLVGTTDAVIDPNIQYEFQTAVQNAGYTVALTKCTGLGHVCDFGTLDDTDCNSWPLNLTTAPAACHVAPHCKNGAATCNVWGAFVEPAISQLLANTTSAAVRKAAGGTR